MILTREVSVERLGQSLIGVGERERVVKLEILNFF